MKINKLNSNSNGFVMAVLLISMSLISVIIVYALQESVLSYQIASKEQYNVNAQFAADSGLDRGLVELTLDSDWVGTGGEITLYDDGNIRTTYSIEVSAGSSDIRKIIKSTGRTYKPSSATTPKSKRIFELEAEAISPSDLSIVTGVGGLIMSNSSKITGGSVFVNGNITMTNTAQIGLSSSPTFVYAAHKSCPVPADATYPRVCNSGENGEPISIGNLAHIYADVYATNQTTGTNMTDGGLIPGQTVAPQALPDHNRAAQTAAVASTDTGDVDCSSGTLNWPANYKIVGNVTIRGGGTGCNVIINGDVWITGKLTLRNSGKITVANGVGAIAPNIMIDGVAGLATQNSSQIIANNVGTGVQILAYWSAASCSPDCADVTGADLYNSKDTVTITLNNTGNAPNTVFYSRWSRVQIQQSSNIGALVGQTVELNNTATVSFGVAVPGFEGPTTWVKKGYLRVRE